PYQAPGLARGRVLADRGFYDLERAPSALHDRIKAVLEGDDGDLLHDPDSLMASSRVWRMKRWYGTPRRFAARLTALRSSPGRRMLMRASLGANSNCMGFRVERLNCVRSLLATNCSAW